jgi:hypothetical protein
MKGDLALAAASRPLGGRPIRPLDARVLVAALLVACALSGAAIAPASLAAGILVPLVAALLGLRALQSRQTAAVRRINTAHEMILAGDFDGAERTLLPVATGRYAIVTVALALHNLGTSCLRRGDLKSAVPLFRATLALHGRQKIRALRGTAHIARTNLAFTLACAGELDLADAALAEPVEQVHPQGRASEVVARALVATRRGDHRAALDLLHRERVYLRNACSAEGAALAEAIEALALEQKEGGYREGHPRRRVPVDPEERAYVLRALPAADPVLVDA